jgi:mono/diheme cytochrome c family protein
MALSISPVNITSWLSWHTGFLLVALTCLAMGCSGDDDSNAVIDGTALYEEHCSSCHLSDGNGDTGPSMFERVPSLTQAELTSVINDGTESEYVSMPGFDDELTDAETTALIGFILTEWGSE